MNNDLTIIYYTANIIDEKFSLNVRNHLLSILPENTPIISISRKPINYGYNICIGEVTPSIYYVYKQILIGAKEATTKYLMMQEDDSLYTLEHVMHRPADDTFEYNSNRWHIYHDVYFHRPRAGMHTCIANRDLMIDTLEKRYKKFPNFLYEEKGELVGFGEPGRSEKRLGLPIVKMKTFNTKIPVLVFDHKGSLGGVRKIKESDHIEKYLEGWGKAEDLWKEMIA